MWKMVSGLNLTLCMLAVADGTPPKDESVWVQCHGRLRHGVVAIGGETTGTTITFNRIVWELKLRDDAEREFADEHNKESVVVTGRLRKIAGVERKVRWIMDVSKLSERDATIDKEGTRMIIQGTLRTTIPSQGNTREMTIVSDGQVWPIQISADAALKATAESLIGQPVILAGSLEQAAEESDAHPVIQVKTLKRPAN